VFFDERLERLPITVVADRQTNLAAVAPHHAGDRRTVIVPGAMAPGLVRPSPRRVIGILMFDLAKKPERLERDLVAEAGHRDPHV
jgi:hypothetical protein